MDPQNLFRIGFFVDGFTFRKANDFYLHHHFARSRISAEGLKSFLLRQLQHYVPRGSSVSIEAHYYHPHPNPAESDYKRFEGVLNFEEHLQQCGFQFHYRAKNSESFIHGNTDLISDMKMLAHFEEIQLAVLVSTQGFYTDVAKFLRQHDIPLVLAGFDFSYHSLEQQREVHWHTDNCLKEEAVEYFALEKVMEQAATSNKYQSLFVNNRPRNRNR